MHVAELWRFPVKSMAGEQLTRADVTLSGMENDGQTARFAEEGYQERYVKFVKSVTTKPVVGVGRFTSPDNTSWAPRTAAPAACSAASTEWGFIDVSGSR